MNLRNAWNHVRLRRGGFAIALAFLLLINAVYALIVADWWRAAILGVLMLVLGISLWRSAVQWVYEAYGARALSANHFSEAEVSLRKSLEWINAPDDPTRGRVLALLTHAAHKQGNYDAAETYGRDWSDAEERIWGSDHPRAADAMEALAAIYDQIARHHQARPLLEAALRVREAYQATDPLKYAMCLKALGTLWCRIERHEQAEPYFRKALEIAQQHSHPASQDVLVIACHLSNACVHVNKLDEADRLAQSSLAWAEKHPEPASMPVAFCLRQLAYVRRFQERYEEAEGLLRRSMEIVRKAAPDKPMLHLHLLGVIMRYQSRWAEAEECFVEELHLRQEYCAPEDMSIARLLEDYAELLELMGRMEEAQTHQNHAKQIRDFHSPFRLV